MDQQVHRARNLDFDKEADEDVLSRSHPRKLEGLDLAEARLAAGDAATASAMARQSLALHGARVQTAAENARAEFILARAALLTGHPEQAISGFQKVLANSQEQRLLSWSHIYLGRMLDLECKRDGAVREYKAALAVRDGQLDTRLAAERGVKNAYSVKGHSCEDDVTDEEIDQNKPLAKPAAVPAQSGALGPQ